MATLETPQDMQRIFEDCDPIYLRQLREAAGIDIIALARTACLSVAQVRHLEGLGEDDVMFYSSSIKRQAYKRVLMILGADPPTAKQEEALEAAMHGLHPEQSHNTIDNIVALVEHAQPMHSTTTVLARCLSMLRSLKSSIWWIFPLLSLLLVLYLLEPFVTGWLDAAGVTTAHASLASKPEEQLVAHESVNAANPLSSDAAPPAVLGPPDATLGKACAYRADDWVKLSAVEAYKAGNYVYLVSDTAATVCVVDGAKQATLLQLQPGQGRSVYGPAPWQVSGGQLFKVQIYFQGRRLTLPETGAQHFSLVESPLTR
jgi:hypothetical protein